jgi:hypothetical protein
LSLFESVDFIASVILCDIYLVDQERLVEEKGLGQQKTAGKVDDGTSPALSKSSSVAHLPLPLPLRLFKAVPQTSLFSVDVVKRVLFDVVNRSI